MTSSRSTQWLPARWRNAVHLALAALLWLAATAEAQPPPPAEAPPEPPAEEAAIEKAGWLERLLFNTRERTRRGLAALEQELPREALEPFRSAGRLAPTNPVAQFNAGTAELLSPGSARETPAPPAGPVDTHRALAPLSFAAENSTGDLTPQAHYNLGNAHLALEDPAAALEAFKDSLRADPANLDAKVNLEIALRKLEQQKQQEEQQQESQEPSDNEKEEGDDQNQEQDSGDQPPPEQPEPDDEGEDDEQEQQQPDFDEQPDMTAEQAAAILEAVENLEREQRRLDAAERARTGSKQGKDW